METEGVKLSAEEIVISKEFVVEIPYCPWFGDADKIAGGVLSISIVKLWFVESPNVFVAKIVTLLVPSGRLVVLKLEHTKVKLKFEPYWTNPDA
mgnify:CR=1 FL=1